MNNATGREYLQTIRWYFIEVYQYNAELLIVVKSAVARSHELEALWNIMPFEQTYLCLGVVSLYVAKQA